MYLICYQPVMMMFKYLIHLCKFSVVAYTSSPSEAGLFSSLAVFSPSVPTGILLRGLFLAALKANSVLV